MGIADERNHCKLYNSFSNSNLRFVVSIPKDDFYHIFIFKKMCTWWDQLSNGKLL